MKKIIFLCLLFIALSTALLTSCSNNTQSIPSLSSNNDKVEECNHQWDEGIEIESGSGGYVMEYTCLLCGSTERETITIIPQEN